MANLGVCFPPVYMLNCNRFSDESQLLSFASWDVRGRDSQHDRRVTGRGMSAGGRRDLPVGMDRDANSVSDISPLF